MSRERYMDEELETSTTSPDLENDSEKDKRIISLEQQVAALSAQLAQLEEPKNIKIGYDPTKPEISDTEKDYLEDLLEGLKSFGIDRNSLSSMKIKEDDKKTWHRLEKLHKELRGSSEAENYFHLETNPPGLENPKPHQFKDPVEIAYIESYSGYQRKVYVPESRENKFKYLRDALALSEAASSEAGDPAADRAVRRADSMIEALREPEYRRNHTDEKDPNYDIGIRLNNELQARKKFREMFLRFESVQDVKAVASLVQQFRAEYLNTLIHIPEVMEFFVEYDLRAQEYIQASKTDTLEDFQKKIVEKIIKRKKESDPEFSERLRKKKEENTDYNENAELEWARRLGERFWMVTGRLSAQDKKIEGKFTGGVFFARRLFNFQRWLIKNKDHYHLHPELMADVDIGNQDFLTSKLPKKIYDIEFNKIKQAKIEELVEKGKTREDAEEEAEKDKELNVKADKTALERVEKVFNGFKPEQKKFDKKKGIYEYDWSGKIYMRDEAGNIRVDEYGIPDPKYTRLVDLSNVDWQEIDFRVFDPISPMLQWSIYNLMNAEDLRDKLKSTFLKVPTSEALAQVKDMWEHLDSDQWTEKGKLIRNFAEYVWKGEGRKKGEYPKLSRADIDLMISQSAYQLGLSAEDSIEVSRMVLDKEGKSLINQLLVIKDFFKPDQAFGIFIWEVIKGIIQQGLSQKG